MILKQENKWVCGIDNGLDGGFVFISRHGKVHFYNMPTLEISGKKSKKTGKVGKKRILDILEIKNIFNSYIPLIKIVHVEAMQVGGRVGKFHQSATSTATSHRNGGIIIGLLVGMGIPYIEIPASVWQRQFFKAKSRKDIKTLSYITCCKLYPNYINEFKGLRGAIKDGLCDALLLATYSKG